VFFSVQYLDDNCRLMTADKNSDESFLNKLLQQELEQEKQLEQ
jgi:hypothetical protein